MKFKKDFLRYELDLPHSAKENKIVDNTRWSIVHEIVFEHEGKFYQTCYSRGATEQQEEAPWEYEDEVECVEVEQVEKVVKVWEPVQ